MRYTRKAELMRTLTRIANGQMSVHGVITDARPLWMLKAVVVAVIAMLLGFMTNSLETKLARTLPSSLRILTFR